MQTRGLGGVSLQEGLGDGAPVVLRGAFGGMRTFLKVIKYLGALGLCPTRVCWAKAVDKELP